MEQQLVLIVEDNPANLQLASFLLTAAGFRVESASTAQEGISKARTLRPQVILMDIELPGMDGMAATQILRADPNIASVRIVALTANAMRGDRERFLSGGFDAYISKPISTKELAPVVMDLVTRGD